MKYIVHIVYYSLHEKEFSVDYNTKNCNYTTVKIEATDAFMAISHVLNNNNISNDQIKYVTVSELL